MPSKLRAVPRGSALPAQANMRRAISMATLSERLIPFSVTLREERVPLLPRFWRPGRISIRGLQGHDGLDPSCHGHGITAKQILLDARFQQGFPRSLQGLAPLRVPLVEFGESLIHGLGTAVEIAFLLVSATRFNTSSTKAS